MVLTAADAPEHARSERSAAFAIRWVPGKPPSSMTIEVVGIDAANLALLAKSNWDAARWSNLFGVWVGPLKAGQKADQPPILGSYRIDGGVLRFSPRFPVEPGLLHRARFRPARLPNPVEGAADVASELTRPRAVSSPTTTVTRIDPAGNRLPENLLKFYIHFSAPMSRGEAYERVHLLDESGKALAAPFLELDEELWDPAGTRLTLFLDPGRIKRGLRPREEAGPVLEAGKGYTLVVDRDWPDAEGNLLREAARKAFRAGTPDETQPDPKTWAVTPPAAASRDPLLIVFPEALDRAMLDRALVVHDADGRTVAGRIEVSADATHWRFHPHGQWRSSTYQLVVDTALEDLAGNSVARPFEVDVQRPISRRLHAETVKIPVKIK
jgi:hypothetical protein